ncbi:hypothetical protein ABZ924_13240 [Streptomyces sp. NPDC046876]|uniref:hypothetical protein n=1 Tax=Streptomyces sp. NPDC046876 TaxID=3155616 RepID=UPI0033DA68C6
MPEAVTSATEPDVDSLNRLCRELAEAADAVGEAARYASELALASRMRLAAFRPGSRRAAAWRTLLRTLTSPAALGWAPRGRGVMVRAGRLSGVLAGRESLAVSLAVLGLKARIRAAAVRHPELLADPASARVLSAIEQDRHGEAIRVFKSIVNSRGAEHAFAVLAPSFADILAWNALTDENPFNDAVGWQVATGRAMTAEPLLGPVPRFRSFTDRGSSGRAGVLTADPALTGALDTSGTIAGYVRNIGLLGTGGILLIQRVIGPDGVQRYVVQLAGTARERDCRSPQDLFGAFNAVASPDSPYTRAASKAVRSVVPSGTEVALIGHGQGGIAAMNLAGGRDFTSLYTLTHVVAVGSPIDAKRPADPRTQVISLVNEHDVVPSLEGRSALSPYRLPSEFTEFTWTDDTHSFPRCHAAERYAHNLEFDVPEAIDHVNAELAAYRGLVSATHLFQLFDR